MTTGTLMFIFILWAVVFTGGLVAAFEYGKEIGIAKREKENEDEIPNDDE
jgi:hypothetical protein